MAAGLRKASGVQYTLSATESIGDGQHFDVVVGKTTSRQRQTTARVFRTQPCPVFRGLTRWELLNSVRRDRSRL